MDILFPAHCTISQAQTLKAMLLEALAQGGELRCSFKDVVEADLSFFQLLTSLKRSCDAGGVALVCLPDLPPHLIASARTVNWGSLGPGPDCYC